MLPRYGVCAVAGLFLLAAPASAQPPQVQRGVYQCESERVRVNTCGWDCQVVYPDRPRNEAGKPSWAVEDVMNVAKRLKSCAFVEYPNGAPARPAGQTAGLPYDPPPLGTAGTFEPGGPSLATSGMKGGVPPSLATVGMSGGTPPSLSTAGSSVGAPPSLATAGLPGGTPDSLVNAGFPKK